MATVSMSDGREIEFGKKVYLLNSSVLEDGSVRVELAFNTGEYRTLTVPIWDGSTLSEAISKYAEAGLVGAIKRLVGDGAEVDFDAVAGLLQAGPDVRKPRARKLKLSPLMQAIVEVTGKDEAQVYEWVNSKSRKERFALSRSAQIAPVLARYLAASKKDDDEEEPDLLAELA